MKQYLTNFKDKLSYAYYMLYGAITTYILVPHSVFADDFNVYDIQLGDDGTLTGVGSGAADSTEATANVFNQIFGNARVLIAGVTGLMAIVMVAIFAYKAFTLSRVGDNPSERAKTIQGMIFFFIGAACFGAASMLTGLFYGLLA